MQVFRKKYTSEQKRSLVLIIGIMILQLATFQNCSQNGLGFGSGGSSKTDGTGSTGPVSTATAIASVTPSPTPLLCPQNEKGYATPVMQNITLTTGTVKSGYGFTITEAVSSGTFKVVYENGLNFKEYCKSTTERVRVKCIPQTTLGNNNVRTIPSLKVKDTINGLPENNYMVDATDKDIDCDNADDEIPLIGGSVNLKFIANDTIDDATQEHRRCMEGSVTFDVYLENRHYNNPRPISNKQTITIYVENKCLPEFKLSKQLDHAISGNQNFLLSDLDSFGKQVVIDGTWAAALAPNDGANNTGAIYVFKKTSDLEQPYVLKQILRTSTLASDKQGTINSPPGAIALKGNILLLGSDLDTGSQGRVWIYKYNSGTDTWDFLNTLSPYAEAGESLTSAYFGKSVSTDGSNIAIGSPGDSGKQGAVYIYDGSGNSLQKIRCGSYCSSLMRFYGSSVAIEGSQLAIGAPQSPNTLSEHSGNVFKYTNSGSGFVYAASFPDVNGTLPTKLTNLNSLKGTTVVTAGTLSLNVGAKFGDRVSIVNGNIIAGAPAWQNATNVTVGLAVVIKPDGKVIRLPQPNEIAGAQFGFSFAMSSTTECVVVGAPTESLNRGFVYQFCPTTQSGQSYYKFGRLIPGLLQSNGNYFGYSLGFDDHTVFVGAHMESGVFSNQGDGIFITVP